MIWTLLLEHLTMSLQSKSITQSTRTILLILLKERLISVRGRLKHNLKSCGFEGVTTDQRLHLNWEEKDSIIRLREIPSKGLLSLTSTIMTMLLLMSMSRMSKLTETESWLKSLICLPSIWLLTKRIVTDLPGLVWDTSLREQLTISFLITIVHRNSNHRKIRE